MRGSYRFALSLLCSLFCFSAAAAPVTLTDLQMDKVTAGTLGESLRSATGGGAIVANESTATVTSAASVNLQDNVQINARALSLTTTAKGSVASGLNVWDGALQDGIRGSSIDVTQLNDLSQFESPVRARLLDYERDLEVLRDARTWADSTAPAQTIKVFLKLDIPSLGTVEGRGEVPASVIPTSKIPGTYGNVVGYAGTLGVQFDGGEFDADFDLASSLSTLDDLSLKGEASAFFGRLKKSLSCPTRWIAPSLILSEKQ